MLVGHDIPELSALVQPFGYAALAVHQNGSIKPETVAIIRADFAQIPAGDPVDVEVARLRAIANSRAESAAPTFIEDVRVRKLTIANGRGTVHNIPYDLEQQFGIRLAPFSF